MSWTPRTTPQAATAATLARPAMPKPSVAFGSGGGPAARPPCAGRVGGALSTLLLWCSFVAPAHRRPAPLKQAAALAPSRSGVSQVGVRVRAKAGARAGVGVGVGA